MSCPNCGSDNHIHCTRKEDLAAMERQVADGKSVMDAAIGTAAEKQVAYEMWLSRLTATAEDLDIAEQSVTRLFEESWPDADRDRSTPAFDQLRMLLRIASTTLRALHELRKGETA